MRKGFLQSLKFIAFLFAGLVLLWLAFRNTDFNKLAADLKEANYYWLILSVTLALIAFVSRARRWVLLINPLGFKPTLANSFYALMTGYLANLALPRIGEITRCVALGKKENIPVDQLFGTVIIERTIDFVSLVAITITFFLVSSDRFGQFLQESFFHPIQKQILASGITWVFWLIITVILIISFILLIRYKKNLRKIRFFAKIFAISRGIINGLKTITSLERKWEFVFHTIFIWILYALMTWVLVFSLESTSHITFVDSLFLLVIGGLAMSVPVQGGLGIFHLTISHGMLLMGVPKEDGLIYALLAHESQLILISIIGAISFFIIFKKDKPILIDPLDLQPLQEEKI